MIEFFSEERVGCRTDSALIEGTEHRPERFFVETPPSNRARVDRLAHLGLTGRANSAAVRVKFEAARMPVETDEFDQTSSVPFDVKHDIFVWKIEPGNRFQIGPMAHDPLIVGQPAAM